MPEIKKAFCPAHFYSTQLEEIEAEQGGRGTQ
mgnify:CR=1 FL=1